MVLMWAIALWIDPKCTWCGGSGTWNGKPCIKCNQ
jgi:hypothetical protein